MILKTTASNLLTIAGVIAGGVIILRLIAPKVAQVIPLSPESEAWEQAERLREESGLPLNIIEVLFPVTLINRIPDLLSKPEKIPPQ